MSVSPRWAFLHGDPAPPPERTPLRAGPLTMALEHGDLRYVRFGDVEVLRRVYVAVRDVNWRTPPMTVSDLQIERGAQSFRVRYVGRFQEREIDFLARVTIDGVDDGTIRFTLDGEALTTFQRNRIGICVLHPVEPCAGRPFQARKYDGSTELGTFPREISPHQPVRDLGILSHEVLPGLTASVRFEGDIFEMEDQRNWTDASFKTYSTPLRLPFPVTVQPGERVTQAVTLTLVPTALMPPAGPWPPKLTFETAPEVAAPLPTIGLGMDDGDEPLSTVERDRLGALRLAHLRVDLDPSDLGFSARLRRAADHARALDLPLEIALFLAPGLEGELATVERLIRMVRPRVCRWLVFDRTTDATTDPALLVQARPLLKTLAPDAPLVSGTNAYFTQLNRGRPPLDALDAVCYSVNPQVHAFDDSSLVETLVGQAWTVESAHSFVGSLPIVVSPVTLRPRFNASATVPEPEPPPGARASTVDPRQASLLGAAWTVGSLAALGPSGVASITYYETLGWRGVLEQAAGPPAPEGFPSQPGGAFPLYHVLADVGEYAGGHVLQAHQSDPLTVTGLVLRQGGRQRVLLANLTPQRQQVTALGLDGAWLLRPLDETSVRWAMADPERFRIQAGTRRVARSGRLDVELAPYAVTRLDRA